MIKVSGFSKIVETMITNKQPSKWCVVYDTLNKTVRLESTYGDVKQGEYVIAYEDEDPSMESLQKRIEEIENDSVEFIKGLKK